MNSKRGVRVIEFLAERSIELDRLEAQQPALPATIDWDDPQHLLQLVNASGAKLIAMREANQQLLLANTALVEDVEQALTEKEVVQRANDDMAAQRAREEKAIALTEWLKHTQTDHGHGEITGRTVMRCLGWLKRENVTNCKTTTEKIPTSWAVQQGVLFTSSTEWGKTKKRTKRVLHEDGSVTLETTAEPVRYSDGTQVMGESRKVLVDADIGTPKLMKWFLSRQECLLRRLVQQRTGSLIQKRLANRYSFMWFDSNSWDELTVNERRAGVRMKLTDEKTWVVECLVRAKGGHPDHIAHGEGRTLEDAYKQLAENYSTPYATPEMFELTQH